MALPSVYKDFTANPHVPDLFQLWGYHKGEKIKSLPYRNLIPVKGFLRMAYLHQQNWMQVLVRAGKKRNSGTSLVGMQTGAGPLENRMEDSPQTNAKRSTLGLCSTTPRHISKGHETLCQSRYAQNHQLLENTLEWEVGFLLKKDMQLCLMLEHKG